MVYRLAGAIAARLLPARCLLCGGPGSGPGIDLCAACAADLPAIDGPACPRCALPATTPAATGYCMECHLRPPPFAACVAAFRYDFPLTRMVPALKYEAALANARVLGRLLAAAVARRAATGADTIVPMPLHCDRLVERGCNQSYEIARFTAAALHTRLDPRALARLRPTVPQVGLSRDARIGNVVGAFAADRRRVHDLRIALVDDVVTTGSTAAAASQALLAAGAARVEVWCVARAPG
ncbi:MAG: double zinc ribbon domain-containing protein [Steroidobacteraceae bacterium]